MEQTCAVGFVYVGNMGFPGLYAAQNLGRYMVEGTGTLGHDEGSLEGCDSCSFVLTSLTRLLSARVVAASSYAKTTTLFF
jgi:hypothetical protein